MEGRRVESALWCLALGAPTHLPLCIVDESTPLLPLPLPPPPNASSSLPDRRYYEQIHTRNILRWAAATENGDPAVVEENVQMVCTLARRVLIRTCRPEAFDRLVEEIWRWEHRSVVHTRKTVRNLLFALRCSPLASRLVRDWASQHLERLFSPLASDVGKDSYINIWKELEDVSRKEEEDRNHVKVCTAWDHWIHYLLRHPGDAAVTAYNLIESVPFLSADQAVKILETRIKLYRMSHPVLIEALLRHLVALGWIPMNMWLQELSLSSEQTHLLFDLIEDKAIRQMDWDCEEWLQKTKTLSPRDTHVIHALDVTTPCCACLCEYLKTRDTGERRRAFAELCDIIHGASQRHYSRLLVCFASFFDVLVFPSEDNMSPLSDEERCTELCLLWDGWLSLLAPRSSVSSLADMAVCLCWCRSWSTHPVLWNCPGLLPSIILALETLQRAWSASPGTPRRIRQVLASIAACLPDKIVIREKTDLAHMAPLDPVLAFLAQRA